jgi:hypothetical protein
MEVAAAAAAAVAAVPVLITPLRRLRQYTIQNTLEWRPGSMSIPTSLAITF